MGLLMQEKVSAYFGLQKVFDSQLFNTNFEENTKFSISAL